MDRNIKQHQLLSVWSSMQEPNGDQPGITQEEIINNLMAVGTIVNKNTAAETASCNFILSINYPEQKIIFPKLLVVQER